MPTVAGTRVPTTMIPREYRGLYGHSGLGISTFWQDLIKLGGQTTADIFKAKYAVPPVGTAITQTPTSTQIIRQGTNPSFGVTTFPGLDFGAGSSDLIKWGLIIGAVVVGLKVVSK